MSTTSQWIAGRASMTNNATRFWPIAGSVSSDTGTEAQTQIPISEAGNFLTLKVVLSAAPGGSGANSYRFQVSINGTPSTTMDVTVTDPATTGSATGTVAVSAGDLLTMKVTRGGTPTGISAVWWLEFEPTTANHYVYFDGFGVNSVSATRYGVGFTAATPQSSDTLGLTEHVAPIPGTVIAAYASIQTAPGGVGKSWDLQLLIAGSPQATVNIANTATTGNSTGLSVAIAAGDIVTFNAVANSTPAATRSIGYCFTFVPTTAGQWVLANGINSGQVVDAYGAIIESHNSGGTAGQGGTEATFQLAAPAALSIVALAWKVTTAPGAGKSVTFSLHDGGANVGPTAVLSDANTLVSNSGTGTIALDDLLNAAFIRSGGPANYGSNAWSFAFTSGTLFSQTIATTLAKVSSNINANETVLTVQTQPQKVSANINVSQRQEETIVTQLVKVRSAINAIDFSIEPNEVWVETWEEQDP